MAQEIDIDLNLEKEVASVVSEAQPGDKVVLHATVKAKDDQTLKLTLSEVEMGEESGETDADLEDEEDDAGMV